MTSPSEDVGVELTRRWLEARENGVIDDYFRGWVLWVTPSGRWTTRSHFVEFASGFALCGVRAPMGDGGQLEAFFYGENMHHPRPSACRACWWAAADGGLWRLGGTEPPLAARPT